jgi:glyoxylase-like metal-dependent hydrolase (beta-lactamase superfamily II)
MKYIFKQLEDKLFIAERGDAILPGLRFVQSPGHRPDHVTLDIASSGHILHHVADTIVHPFQLLSRDWHSSFDTYPYEAVLIRRKLLDSLASSGALVFASHMPFPGLGRIEVTDEGWRWIPSDSPESV